MFDRWMMRAGKRVAGCGVCLTVGSLQSWQATKAGAFGAPVLLVTPSPPPYLCLPSPSAYSCLSFLLSPPSSYNTQPEVLLPAALSKKSLAFPVQD